MGGHLLTSLSMENHIPSTLLSMEPSGVAPSCVPLPVIFSNSSHEECERELLIQQHSHQTALSGPPPDINLPFSNPDTGDLLDVGLGSHTLYDSNAMIAFPKPSNRKAAKRGDSIWGAWFFFNFYFKPLLSDKSKSKIKRDVNGVIGFDRSDLRLDSFLVQHDMENMYMWIFKERPENALGKMQLRSYMNGHSRPGEPQFPFSVDKGFVRSHRMQRKHYRGLSNPQCIHGIEVVQSPNLTLISDGDKKRWTELTGRELNFSIPPEASDFGCWRNLFNTEFELDRFLPAPPSLQKSNSKKHLNGSGLNLSSPSDKSRDDGMDLSPVSNCKKRKDTFAQNGMDQEECFVPLNPCTDRVGTTQIQDVEMHTVIRVEPHWVSDFTGVMRQACGPVTAAKTIYEDEAGYLIMVSLPFVDQQQVKVSWRNSLTHGIVKIQCNSIARMPYLKWHDRIFKLSDPDPEHCPPGEFIREIPLATRIPEDAKLEAYFDETGCVLEIIVPKHRSGPEEHEVRVCMRPPHLGTNELLLT